jgi:hypothetical protein
VSPREDAEQTVREDAEQTVKEKPPEQTAAEQPPVMKDPAAREREQLAWSELSSFLKKSGEPAQEPPPLKAPETHAESAAQQHPALPARENNRIALAIILLAEYEDIVETFIKNTTDALNKMAKGTLAPTILNRMPIDGNAFDPHMVIDQLIQINPEVVLCIGFEKASQFKLAQLTELLDEKQMFYQLLQRNKLDKNFTYVSIAADLMLSKQKIIGRNAV